MINSALVKKTSGETPEQMSVTASIVWALNCLYSGPPFSLRHPRSRSMVSPKWSLNFSLITTAVDAKAVTEFSFWIEIPVFIKFARIGEMVPMWGSTNSSDAPSIKLVIAEQQWADTLGTGSLRALIRAGRTIAPYSSWKSSVISSEICPIQWRDACLTLGFWCYKCSRTCGTMAAMPLTSSIYSPTWENAISAAFLYLQSSWFWIICSTNPESKGRHFSSPTAEMILSIEDFPKFTLSSPSSSLPLL